MKFAILLLILVTSQAWSQMACRSVYTGGDSSSFSIQDGRSWSFQIYHREMDNIQKSFEKVKGLSSKEQIETLLAENTRQSFFRLEVLSKIYRHANEEKFSSFADRMKEVEDAFGRLALAKEMNKLASDVNEPKLEKYFSDEKDDARSDLIDLLNDMGLLKNPAKAVQKIRAELDPIREWMDPVKDRMYLSDALEMAARELQTDVLNRKFDNKHIEKGLHELRRKLRGLILQFVAMDGVAKLDFNAKVSAPIEKWYKEVEQSYPNILQHKYLAVSEPGVSQPILIPAKEAAIIASLVESIGASKDTAEALIVFKEALKEMGKKDKRIEAVQDKILEKLQAQDVDHRALANDLQDRLQETDLLVKFADSLRQQRTPASGH